jgi:hypothetical protein
MNLSVIYATVQWDHNFSGRVFARIPFMRKLNWREMIGAKVVYGSISDANRAINASGLLMLFPEKKDTNTVQELEISSRFFA